MKQIIVILLFVAQSGQAQRVWGVYEGSIAGTRYTVLTECEDTLVAGETWQKLESKSKYWRNNKWWTESVSVIKRSNGTVYHQDYNGNRRMIYDYNLQVGDIIKSGLRLRYSLEVYARDTIHVLGRDRVRLKLKEINWGYEDEWIEGIGSTLNNYKYPGESPGIVDGGSWSVSFTEDGGNTIYKRADDSLMSYLVDTVFNCSIVTDINSNNRFEVLNMTNPIDDISQLRFFGTHDLLENVELWSINGHRIFNGKLQKLKGEKIKSGLYILKARSKTHVYLSRLIIN